MSVCRRTLWRRDGSFGLGKFGKGSAASVICYSHKVTMVLELIVTIFLLPRIPSPFLSFPQKGFNLDRSPFLLCILNELQHRSDGYSDIVRRPISNILF